MKVLAFDTTNSTISIVLLKDQKLLTQTLISDSGKQSELLIPEIEKVLTKNKIWYQDLDLLAATQGPGSFTGVRIGLTAARTLKIATNLPLILINSLEALAFKHRQHQLEILVAIDAKMDEFFVSSFSAKNGKLENLLESQLVKLEDLSNFLPKNRFLACGSGKNTVAKMAAEKNIPHEIAEEDHIEAEIVGLLALEKFSSDNSRDQNQDPLYLRGPKITERKK